MAAKDQLTSKLESGEQKIPKSQIHVVVQNGSGRLEPGHQRRGRP